MASSSSSSSSSSNQETHFHTRSISLPSASHPTTLRFTEELNKLKTWESTVTPRNVETILIGLTGLANLKNVKKEIRKCLKELIANVFQGHAKQMVFGFESDAQGASSMRGGASQDERGGEGRCCVGITIYASGT
ncbi:hypothetical protein Scep_000178 [Stephania cephalantha]|uniref:Uncharacterized protein n=1 Tax=Stephania cephalantha TaxID=152367 RepID=A0AAP0L730_9MAGN